MRYAHLADAHLGSWREPKMRDLSTEAFVRAIDDCLQKEVDFILFAGDLFNTSLPSLETLKIVAKKMKEVKDKNVPLYAIAGSHDFSPSGKTMIDVLENAGLLINVCRGKIDSETKLLHPQFTMDEKTGVKLTGILGRKGQLDKTYYQNLSLDDMEKEAGYKIFLFHTPLTELKPKHLQNMESQPASFLPRGFNYYAGGHVHHPSRIDLPGYGPMTYPGALFPTTFAEVEHYGQGGYYLITIPPPSDCGSGSDYRQEVEWIPLQMKPAYSLKIDGQGKNAEQVTEEMVEQISTISSTNSLAGSIITIRLWGSLSSGRTSDINFNSIIEQLNAGGVYFVMKNTSALTSAEFSEVKMTSATPETMEDDIIKEHLQQFTLFDAETERQLTKNLLTLLNTGKKEGETASDFQARVESELNQVFNFSEKKQIQSS